MKIIKKRLYLYAGAAAFGGVISVPFFINITGSGKTEWIHLLLILSAAILASVFAVRESRRLRSARLIVENQILHIQSAVFQEHRRRKRLENLSEESVEVFVSGFGILLGSKVIKFNQDGIRLKAVEIGCDHLSLDYGTETVSQNVRLLHAGVDSGKLENTIERFRYETGVLPVIAG